MYIDIIFNDMHMNNSKSLFASVDLYLCLCLPLSASTCLLLSAFPPALSGYVVATILHGQLTLTQCWS